MLWRWRVGHCWSQTHTHTQTYRFFFDWFYCFVWFWGWFEFVVSGLWECSQRLLLLLFDHILPPLSFGGIRIGMVLVRGSMWWPVVLLLWQWWSVPGRGHRFLDAILLMLVIVTTRGRRRRCRRRRGRIGTAGGSTVHGTTANAIVSTAVRQVDDLDRGGCRGRRRGGWLLLLLMLLGMVLAQQQVATFGR